MGKRVLIVDDSALIRFEIADILEELNLEIAGEASDGQKAIQIFKESKPDIVTLDIVMPNKNGIETLKEMLEIKPDTKIIMLTAIGNKNQLVEAIKIGAFDYIEKPLVKEKVVEVLNRLLQ